MAAHRYWRINFTSPVGGSAYTLFDVEFRTAAGGPDVTDGAGGTASANSSLAGTAPANLFDNNPTNRWGIALGSGWIQYDFGAGNAKDVIEFTMVCGPSVAQAPKNFTLQCSDDGSTFTIAATYSEIIGWGPGQRRTFRLTGEIATAAPPAATRYWRFVARTLQGGGSTISIAEMEFRESAGGIDLGTSGTVFNGNTPNTGKDAVYCYDGNASTTWDAAQPAWHYHDFGAGVAKTIEEIAIMANASSAASAPTSFVLQRSTDALGWTTVIDLSDITGWVAGQTRYFQSTGEVSGMPAASPRRVVFVCT